MTAAGRDELVKQLPLAIHRKSRQTGCIPYSTNDRFLPQDSTRRKPPLVAVGWRNISLVIRKPLSDPVDLICQLNRFVPHVQSFKTEHNPSHLGCQKFYGIETRTSSTFCLSSLVSRPSSLLVLAGSEVGTVDAQQHFERRRGDAQGDADHDGAVSSGIKNLHDVNGQSFDA